MGVVSLDARFWLQNIMNAHTYHVDTLLQTSELCKLNEDLQMSAELVERAVYCMECALHPSFNIASGKCRLSYKKQTNRAFFITLFKHMMFVGGRAFYRYDMFSTFFEKLCRKDLIFRLVLHKFQNESRVLQVPNDA